MCLAIVFLEVVIKCQIHFNITFNTKALFERRIIKFQSNKENFAWKMILEEVNKYK